MPRREFPSARILFWTVLLVGGLFAAVSHADDWPRFHGPKNDNISTETGLLKQWPDGGPQLLWQSGEFGFGYTSVAIADGLIYAAGNRDENTVVTALDLDGNVVWQKANGGSYDRSFPGARGTPTLDDGRLYHMNADGNVICLKAKTGETLWQADILQRFDGRNIRWALSESLLVDGDRVICTPGGEEIGMAALDKRTGETVWTCTGIGDEPAYCSPLLVEHAGLRQIVTMTASSAIGVHAETGELLWKYEHKAPYNVNCTTPIFHDAHLMLFGTWGRGATKLKLHVDGERCDVEEVWRTRDMDNEHGGVVLVDGNVYGHADGNHTYRHWACIDWETGETAYEAEPFKRQRTGTTSYADGMLYIMGEKREVALVKATPEKFEIVSQFELPDQGKGPTWAHMVIHAGRLYIRHAEFLYVYDIRAN